MGKRKHIINLMFTITLLGVFALTALSVAVMGARVYSHSAEQMQANFDTRTSLVYISEKVKQCGGGNFELRKMAGGDALVLTETYDGDHFESWIFVADGQLREAVVAAGVPVSPQDGQAIMELVSLSIRQEGKLIIITVENSGGDVESLTLSRRM